MSNEQDDVLKQHAPDKLLRGFSGGSLIAGLVLATVIHAVVIGGSSIGFIRDTWIDPEGAAVRKQQAEDAARAAMKAAAGQTNETAAAVAPVTNAAPAVPTVKSDKPATDEGKMREDRKDTPIMKEITEVAPTNEIPRVPDDLGLSIRDVKVK